MLKADIELSDGSETTIGAKIERVRGIETRAEAQAYAAEVKAKIDAAQAAKVETPPLAPVQT